MRQLFLTFPLLFSIVACNGSDATDEETDTDTDTDSDTDSDTDADTDDTDSAPFVPTIFSVSGAFGIDTSGNAVPADVPDASGNYLTYPPGIAVTFATDAYLSATTESELDLYSCLVLITVDQTSPASWVGNTPAWTGFSASTSATVDATDCDLQGWADTIDDPGTMANQGFGSGPSPIQSSVEAQIAQYPDQATKDYLQANAVGGGFHVGTVDVSNVNPPVPNGFADLGLTIVYAVDGDMKVQLETVNNQTQIATLPKENINVGGGNVASGYYSVQGLTFLPASLVGAPARRGQPMMQHHVNPELAHDFTMKRMRQLLEYR